PERATPSGGPAVDWRGGAGRGGRRDERVEQVSQPLADRRLAVTAVGRLARIGREVVQLADRQVDVFPSVLHDPHERRPSAAQAGVERFEVQRAIPIERPRERAAVEPPPPPPPPQIPPPPGELRLRPRPHP